MLNGKFYTGLTANQLSRRSASGPDRQKSHFFWPDETDTVPPSPRNGSGQARSRGGTPQNHSQTSSSVAVPPSTTPDREINTKELFHKQLTSKIEFNDDLHKDVPTTYRRNVRTIMAENAASSAEKYNLNNNVGSGAAARDRSGATATVRPNTFGSKIEFYDYADDDQRTNAATPTPRTSTPKGSDRRITFDESSSKRSASGSGSILKNNEVRAVEHAIAIEKTPEFRKNNVPPPRRINLSKSVENISKLEISNAKTSAPYEKEVNVSAAAAAAIIPTTTKSHRRLDYHHQEEDHQHSYRRNDDEPIKSRNSSVRNEYSYRDSNGTNYRHEEHDEWSNRGRINANASYDVEEKKYSPNSRNSTYSPQSRNSTYSPHPLKSTPQHNDEYAQSNSGVGGRRYSPSKQQIYDDDVDGRSPSKGYVRPLVIPQYPNEAATRAHSHLRSNIFFNDSSYEENQPRSVRESAVGRVGVGLPNI